MAYVYRVDLISENWLVYPNHDTETRRAKRFKKADHDGVRRCFAEARAQGLTPSVSFVWRDQTPASNTPKRHERVVHVTRVGDGWRALPGHSDEPLGWPAMVCVDVALSRPVIEATEQDVETVRRRVGMALRWRYPDLVTIVTLSDAPRHEYRLERDDGSVVWTEHEHVVDRIAPEVEARIRYHFSLGYETEAA